jgi:hypothetical protein
LFIAYVAIPGAVISGILGIILDKQKIPAILTTMASAILAMFAYA